MAPELVVALCAVVGAVIAGALSFSTEHKKARRLLVAVASTLSVVGIISGAEGTGRSSSLAKLTQDVDRHWIVLQNTPVKSLEIEFFTPDGFFTIGDFLKQAKNIQLRIAGMDFASLIGSGDHDKILFSELITKESLTTNGRLGVASAKIRQSKDKPTSEVISSTCTESHFITKQILSGPGNIDNRLVCSATITVPVSDSAQMMQQIAKSNGISLIVQNPMSFRCAACKVGIISIRLVFTSIGPDEILPDMIDISPMSYQLNPSSASPTEIVFSLPGKSLIELAKSYYVDSYGFRNLPSFPVTRGLLYGLYAWLTERHLQRVKIIDVVWSTNEYIDDDFLKAMLPPDEQETALPYQLGEWCGFGVHSVCWYRFALIDDIPK